MEFYFLIFAVLVVFAWFGQERNAAPMLAFMAALMLLLIVGGRYEVGCDYLAYELRFFYLEDIDFKISDVFVVSEYGFVLLNDLVYNSGGEFNSLLFVSAIISMSGIWYFSLRNPNPPGFIASVFPVLVVQLGMSGIRQAMALGLLMVAFSFFISKRGLWVALFVFFAFLFHASAIAFLPLAVLTLARLGKYRYAVAGVFAVPAAYFIIGERLEVYSDRYIEQIYGENDAGGAWVRMSLVVLPSLAAIMYRRVLRASFPALAPIILLFSYVSLMLPLVGLISTVALHRLVFYFLPVSVLALNVVAIIYLPSRYQSLAFLAPIVLHSVYFFGWVTFSRHAQSCYVPYSSWIF
jgi:hypothetical protein